MQEVDLEKELICQDADFDTWALLRQASDAMYAARARELKKYKISPRESAILFHINNLGELAIPAEIARWAVRKPQTITSILNRMEKKGLIERNTHKKGKNIQHITLTEKGTNALKDSTKRECLRQVFSHFSEEECDSLRSYLRKLRDIAVTVMPTKNNIYPFP